MLFTTLVITNQSVKNEIKITISSDCPAIVYIVR